LSHGSFFVILTKKMDWAIHSKTHLVTVHGAVPLSAVSRGGEGKKDLQLLRLICCKTFFPRADFYRRSDECLILPPPLSAATLFGLLWAIK
jgi:hypothetical protein